MATTRQMMARPQPGMGWFGVTAVVTTELVELELVLLLSVVAVVVLTTVDGDVVTVVVSVVVEIVVDVDVVAVVVDVVVGMIEDEGELLSVVVELFLRIILVVSSVSFSAGGFIVTELSIGLPLATENISIIKKSVVVRVTTPRDILSVIT